ncbi:lasso RiPP family leader peptide-containing protein [Streptomyces sp. NPDC048290]
MAEEQLNELPVYEPPALVEVGTFDEDTLGWGWFNHGDYWGNWG